MAQRRMFAKTIIDSDAFLDMPSSSQNLYFHLAMRADDDGFVNQPKAIMRTCGAKDDDMRVLISKKYIIPFDSGVVVIKHWRIHNIIQKDRYKETTYKEEKDTLFLDENNAYSTTPRLEETMNVVEDAITIQEEEEKPKISILKEFLVIYGNYPCGIGKSKKSSLNLYYQWLNGKQISIMGSKKTVRYNHIQIRFALEKFINDYINTEEQYIPRLPTFLGEKTLCDFITATKTAYEDFMRDSYGDGWAKVRFEYEKGGF